MAVRVVWTEIASEDLREIVRYIALDDPNAAVNLAQRVFARIEATAEFPRSNRIVPEKDDASVREAILTPYRVVYSIDPTGTAIRVLRIWHASRGIPEIG